MAGRLKSLVNRDLEKAQTIKDVVGHVQTQRTREDRVPLGDKGVRLASVRKQCSTLSSFSPSKKSIYALGRAKQNKV